MKRNLNYKEEILKIININGGCITGFLKLQKMGDFHSTTLQNHLLEMAERNQIIITKSKVGRKWTKYCAITPHYGFKLKKEDRTIIKIRRLKEKTSSYEKRVVLVSNIVKIAFNKFKNIFLGQLSSKLLENYPIVPGELNHAKRHYWYIIQNEFKELKESDRRRIINSMFESNPEKCIWEKIENSELIKVA